MGAVEQLPLDNMNKRFRGENGEAMSTSSGTPSSILSGSTGLFGGISASQEHQNLIQIFMAPCVQCFSLCDCRVSSLIIQPEPIPTSIIVKPSELERLHLLCCISRPIASSGSSSGPVCFLTQCSVLGQLYDLAPFGQAVPTLDPLAAGCVHPFPAVRLRGLPFGSSREEIADFLEVRPIDIVFQERGGRPNGVAFVLTANSEDYQRCIDKDKQNLGSRYIEVFPCARSVRSLHAPLSSASLQPEGPHAD